MGRGKNDGGRRRAAERKEDFACHGWVRLVFLSVYVDLFFVSRHGCVNDSFVPAGEVDSQTRRRTVMTWALRSKVSKRRSVDLDGCSRKHDEVGIQVQGQSFLISELMYHFTDKWMIKAFIWCKCK